MNKNSVISKEDTDKLCIFLINRFCNDEICNRKCITCETIRNIQCGYLRDVPTYVKSLIDSHTQCIFYFTEYHKYEVGSEKYKVLLDIYTTVSENFRINAEKYNATAEDSKYKLDLTVEPYKCDISSVSTYYYNKVKATIDYDIFNV